MNGVNMNSVRNKSTRYRIGVTGAVTAAVVIKIMLLAFAVILCTRLVGCEEDNLAYNVGWDTVEWFGDGRFQIAKSNDEYCLCDESQEFLTGVENHIKAYKKIAPYVYVIGTEGAGIFRWSDDTHVQNGVNLYIDGKRTEVNIDADDMDSLTVYTKVNYETGEVVQKTTIDGFDDEDKKVFDELAVSGHSDASGVVGCCVPESARRFSVRLVGYSRICRGMRAAGSI